MLFSCAPNLNSSDQPTHPTIPDCSSSATLLGYKLADADTAIQALLLGNTTDDSITSWLNPALAPFTLHISAIFQRMIDAAQISLAEIDRMISRQACMTFCTDAKPYDSTLRKNLEFYLHEKVAEGQFASFKWAAIAVLCRLANLSGANPATVVRAEWADLPFSKLADHKLNADNWFKLFGATIYSTCFDLCAQTQEHHIEILATGVLGQLSERINQIATQQRLAWEPILFSMAYAVELEQQALRLCERELNELTTHSFNLPRAANNIKDPTLAERLRRQTALAKVTVDSQFAYITLNSPRSQPNGLSASSIFIIDQCAEHNILEAEQCPTWRNIRANNIRGVPERLSDGMLICLGPAPFSDSTTLASNNLPIIFRVPASRLTRIDTLSRI